MDFSDFDGNYTVTRTAMTIFGITTKIGINSQEGKVTFTLPGAAPLSFNAIFDPTSGSVVVDSTIAGQVYHTEISMTQNGGLQRFIYATSLVGDPEQAGVWGAEDDGPGGN